MYSYFQYAPETAQLSICDKAKMETHTKFYRKYELMLQKASQLVKTKSYIYTLVCPLHTKEQNRVHVFEPRFYNLVFPPPQTLRVKAGVKTSLVLCPVWFAGSTTCFHKADNGFRSHPAGGQALISSRAGTGNLTF